MVENKQPGTGGLAAAWGVHLFTSLGVVIAFLALLAIERQQPREALLWLVLALAVDGIDGTLARAARVNERLPRIDGAALDLVIDYLTFVFLPVLIIWHGDYLPPALALPLCAAILSSSLYVFARRDMKTDDGYFRGFPALWNVVALYFFVIQPDEAVSAIAIIALVVMTFAPVHVVHPFRAPGYGWLLPALSIAWAVSSAGLLLPRVSAAVSSVLVVVSLGSAAAVIAIGLLRTVRGAPQPQ